MGILNVTDNSFSDGNKFINVDMAFEHAMKMIEDGADLIDIGGESSRPGSVEISPDLEIERVIPVITKIRRYSDIPISVDTYKPTVAREALNAGADIINDITAMSYEKDNTMINVLNDYEYAKIILMHMQGTPLNMQDNPVYENVVQDIYNFFINKLTFLKDNQIDLNRVITDPGIGFGKNFFHNIELIKNIEKFKHLMSDCFNQKVCPVLLGASRKSFINHIYPSKPHNRLVGSLASSVVAFKAGISFIRVHDVKEHKQLLQSLEWMY